MGGGGAGGETEGKKKEKKSEWTEKVEIRPRMNFLAVGEACMAIF